jgi:GNAT superfamily N-acetyltransferase
VTRGDPVPGYRLSEDPAAFDIDAIHGYLTESYWAEGISRETVERSIRGSLACVAIFDPEGSQVGFSRAVSDGATFAWVADVYVLEAHQGKGLASWMLSALLANPALHGLRRTVLATRDAHALYARFGFVPLRIPDRWMEKFDRTLDAERSEEAMSG